MEKEGPEQPITELDNSVTSEEDNSLAEKEKEMDKNNEIIEKGAIIEKHNSEAAEVEQNPSETLNATEDKKDVKVDAENTLADPIVTPSTIESSKSNGQESVSEETELLGEAIEPTPDLKNQEDNLKEKEDLLAETNSDIGELVDKSENSNNTTEIAEIDNSEANKKDNDAVDLESVKPEIIVKSEPPADLDIIERDSTVINEGGASEVNPEIKVEEDALDEPEMATEKPTKTKDKVDNKADDGSVQEPEDAKTTSIQEDVEDWDGTDFTKLNQEELVDAVKKLGKLDNPFYADKILQVIAPLFNNYRTIVRKKALDLFLKEGGKEEEFHYAPDDLSLSFDANYKLIKSKKSKRFKEQDKERAVNLILAEETLEKLRTFVDSEESSTSFNHFKEIQQKWKAIGDVPSQKSRTLWANYNALVDRFYDQRGIYFELKELDKKKNYELKQILCEKAEKLEHVQNIREAIKSLNDLHNEYKHLGPVPRELQEELWQRFKLATDKVYEKRKVFINELKTELNENLAKKQDLVEKIKVYIDYNSDRIKEWNEKTKEVLGLQKAWESTGGLPKDKAKHINKEFWSSFKGFFGNKHKFFKRLDADREINLTKKQELIAHAEKLKDSQEWLKTAEAFKKLQNDWREIGPVPEKLRNKLYEEFKNHCDFFFEEKRGGMKQSKAQFKENLLKKKAIVEKINTYKGDADSKLDDFNNLREEFNEIGFVPRNDIASIKELFQACVDEFLTSLTVLNQKEKMVISLESEFSNLAGSAPNEKELYHKEQVVRRHINKIEDDIALWQNNLEFFAKSKTADQLKLEVNKKIDSASGQLDGLKRQLKMLRSI